MRDRTKYPIKTSLEITEVQHDFVQRVAKHLTQISGKNSKRGVSQKAVWRMFNDHCRTCVIFLESISMDTDISTDEITTEESK